jgi:hypothetical protein
MMRTSYQKTKDEEVKRLVLKEIRLAVDLAYFHRRNESQKTTLSKREPRKLLKILRRNRVSKEMLPNFLYGFTERFHVVC